MRPGRGKIFISCKYGLRAFFRHRPEGCVQRPRSGRFPLAHRPHSLRSWQFVSNLPSAPKKASPGQPFSTRALMSAYAASISLRSVAASAAAPGRRKRSSRHWLPCLKIRLAEDGRGGWRWPAAPRLTRSRSFALRQVDCASRRLVAVAVLSSDFPKVLVAFRQAGDAGDIAGVGRIDSPRDGLDAAAEAGGA